VYDFREIIKREHDAWIDSLKVSMEVRGITYQDIAEVLNITRQSVWLKVNKKSPIVAVEKEIINHYLKIKKA